MWSSWHPDRIHFSVYVWEFGPPGSQWASLSKEKLWKRQVSRKNNPPSASRSWSFILDLFCWSQLSVTLILCPPVLTLMMPHCINHLHSPLCVRPTCLTLVVVANPWFLMVKCCQLASTVLGSHHPHCYLRANLFHSLSCAGPGPQRRVSIFFFVMLVRSQQSLLYVCGKRFVLWVGLPQSRRGNSVSDGPLPKPSPPAMAILAFQLCST